MRWRLSVVNTGKGREYQQNRQSRYPSENTKIPTIPLPPGSLHHIHIRHRQPILAVLKAIFINPSHAFNAGFPSTADSHDILRRRPPVALFPPTPEILIRNAIFQILLCQRTVACLKGMSRYPGGRCVARVIERIVVFSQSRRFRRVFIFVIIVTAAARRKSMICHFGVGGGRWRMIGICRWWRILGRVQDE
jgi:hypothetical protein